MCRRSDCCQRCLLKDGGAGDGNRTRAVSLGSIYRAWPLSRRNADLRGRGESAHGSPLFPALMGTPRARGTFAAFGALVPGGLGLRHRWAGRVKPVRSDRRRERRGAGMTRCASVVAPARGSGGCEAPSGNGDQPVRFRRLRVAGLRWGTLRVLGRSGGWSGTRTGGRGTGRRGCAGRRRGDRRGLCAGRSAFLLRVRRSGRQTPTHGRPRPGAGSSPAGARRCGCVRRPG